MTTAAAVAELKLTERDYHMIAQVVHERAGIHLGARKQQLVYTRLARRLRKLSLPTFKDYCERLTGDDAESEIGYLLNAITTNLTSFFREGHHFEQLAQELEPCAGEGRGRRVRVWSSACSSGEEPYSIAMTLRRLGFDARTDDAKVLATDIDTNVLERGRRGLYGDEAFKRMARAEVERFTEPCPLDGIPGRAICGEVKAFVHFKRLNLMGAWPMHGPFDAIFCRNVIIYFDAPTKARLVDRLADLLRPGGTLYLGHSESLVRRHPKLSLVGRTAYRRDP